MLEPIWAETASKRYVTRLQCVRRLTKCAWEGYFLSHAYVDTVTSSLGIYRFGRQELVPSYLEHRPQSFSTELWAEPVTEYTSAYFSLIAKAPSRLDRLTADGPKGRRRSLLLRSKTGTLE